MQVLDEKKKVMTLRMFNFSVNILRHLKMHFPDEDNIQIFSVGIFLKLDFVCLHLYIAPDKALFFIYKY